MIAVFSSDADRLMHAPGDTKQAEMHSNYMKLENFKEIKLSSFLLFHFCDSLDGSMCTNTPIKFASVLPQNAILAAGVFPG